MPLPEVIEISGGGYSARIAPRLGGRMSRLFHPAAGEILVPLPEDQPYHPDSWPKAGAYPLFPFHNRLRGASFDLAGRRRQLRGLESLGGDIMHGPAQKRAWAVLEQAGDRVVLGLDYPADADWPFPFRARQSFRLGKAGLELGLRLENAGPTPMPGGMGWHPYLRVVGGQPGWLDARLAYPLDAQDLPDGSEPVPRAAGRLDAPIGRTRHLADWTQAGVRLEGAVVLGLRADPVFRHLALHRMPDYLCLEPVTHAAGAHSLPEARWQDAGLALLAPGSAVEGDIRLSLETAVAAI